MTAVRDRSSRSDFFVERTSSRLVDPKFFEEARSIHNAVNDMVRSDVIERYLSLQTKAVRIEPCGPSKYLVRSEESDAVIQGRISPSMFIEYRMCARRLALKIMEMKRLGGIIVSADTLRAFLRGLLVHRLYFEKYAKGETEVRVESATHGIVGYIDELRREDRYVVVEIKSGYRPDVVGAGLQVATYMLCLSEMYGTSPDEMEGYIVSLGGTYRVRYDERVLEEYLRRLRTVVDIGLREDVENLPPRLSSKLSHRCSSCPYYRRCISLPDRYRSYDRFFEAMGFEKLRSEPRRGLLSYAKIERNL